MNLEDTNVQGKTKTTRRERGRYVRAHDVARRSESARQVRKPRGEDKKEVWLCERGSLKGRRSAREKSSSLSGGGGAVLHTESLSALALLLRLRSLLFSLRPGREERTAEEKKSSGA